MKYNNLLASAVVFLVAVPLSLGISLACGAPAESGIVAGIIGGIVVGLLSGAPLMVSGPAAGLIALVVQMQAELGWQGLLLATSLAGVFQLLFGIFRMGKMFEAVPSSVLSGMLGAIGFSILVGQIHVLMGVEMPKGVGQAITTLPAQLLNVLSSSSLLLVFGVGLVAIATQLCWTLRSNPLSWIPSALPAVLLASVIGLSMEMPRVEVAPLGNYVSQESGRFFSAGTLSTAFSFEVILAALGLALVASAESLLTAKALLGFQMGDKPMSLNLNRELLAQGSGNILSGMAGGLPLTGVIVRSAANINAGATNRLSTILHGVWIAVFVLGLSGVLEKVPLTALASILVLTGVKLLNLKKWRECVVSSKWDGALWTVTFVAILFTNLLLGLGVGLILAVWPKAKNKVIQIWNEKGLATGA